MSVTKTMKLLPAIGLASLLALPALAQTAPSSPAPAAPATSGTMAPASTGTMAPATAAKPAKAKSTSTHASLPAAQQFSTESAAATHCPNSTVEWTALGHSKTYHASSSKLFGKTKHGAYACKSDLDTAGFHPAKN